MVPVKNGAMTAPWVVMKAELDQSYMAHPKMVLRSLRNKSVKAGRPRSTDRSDAGLR